MSKIRLHGSSSGYTEIAPVAASGNNTLTLPNDGTIISKDSAGAVGVTSIKSSNVNVGAAVTITESGIEASGIGITCASINGTQIGGRRNIFINGAMQVAQRATSYTGVSAYGTVDRWYINNNGVDENPTQAQVDVASGTTPYSLGFRKALKITNGNQTGGVGGTDRILIQQRIESQNLAQSGWNYTSSSSFITLSFWCKSSVAQTFQCRFQTQDGTQLNFPFETGSLSADTWTKVIKTIPGNSNLTFDVNNEEGMKLEISLIRGTDYTDNSVTNDAWATYASGTRNKDNTTTWYTTNDATFELTGVQLEVGPQATSFEFRSIGEELTLCYRYYYLVGSQARDGNPSYTLGLGALNTDTSAFMHFSFPTEMRSTPTLDHTNGADYYRFFNNGGGANLDGAFTIWNATRVQSFASCTLDNNLTQGGAVFGTFNDNSALLGFSAEL